MEWNGRKKKTNIEIEIKKKETVMMEVQKKLQNL
jgi:hypothetical protein|tara:strand:- start:67 stop:168 length:102 start_codon:yes stop_codon:yes gene_type:complete